MTTVLEEIAIIEDEWRGLYKDSWTGVIVPEAFAHPAKFSRALIRFIYQHVIDRGWINVGDSVVDPFGGVALGGFDAMRHGLNWIGCELEEKFVGLGNQNIALWNDRYSRMPNWGTARLVQGDSRKLASVLSEARCCVSSPPYLEPCGHGGKPTEIDLHKRTGGNQMLYGSSEGQLGAMKEGDLNLAISSPPYIESLKPETEEQTAAKQLRIAKSKSLYDGRKLEQPSPGKAGLGGGYGITDGNLAAMPEGQLAITSPPYNPPMSQDHNGSRGGQRGTMPSEKGAFVKYGNSEGQLEGMRMEGFDDAIHSDNYNRGRYSENRNEAHMSGLDESVKSGSARTELAISSPPYEGNEQHARPSAKDAAIFAGRTIGSHGCAAYGESENNLGNQRGETFWSASRIILEQLHSVLSPDAHAVFVVKAFVRDKQIVDFPAQWAQLCEAVGFRLVHHHKALLVENYGMQGGFDEDREIKTERKSFFRRLAESKGSPRIDHESVLCFEKHST